MSRLEMGYGFAGGGVGAYEYCEEHGVVNKWMDPEGADELTRPSPEDEILMDEAIRTLKRGRDDDEMQRALEADGEKLRGLTGEDHGPWNVDQSEEDYGD